MVPQPPVLFIASPTAYRALRDNASIVVPSVPTTLHAGTIVAIGEPWAVRQLNPDLFAVEYRHTGQSLYVFDEALRADIDGWILPVDQWHTEMAPWAVRRYARIVDLYHNAADGSVAALIRKTVSTQ